MISVDVKKGIVHLNGGGIADGRDEQVPIARFQKAWKTGDFRMVLTEDTHK